METHGVRRAAEMEEVCRTLSELGVDPVMSRGTVIRQRGAAKKNIGERIEA
jgi:predicted component of type VI protein secretion system